MTQQLRHDLAPQFAHNANLDGMGFSPFGKVLGNGMDVVDQIFSGHGESPDQVRRLAPLPEGCVGWLPASPEATAS